MLTFVHLSDTHIHADPAYGTDKGRASSLAGAEALVRAVNALPFDPAFVLHTGDVAYDPDESAYLKAREVLGRLRFPVHYLAGNHDDPVALQRTLLGSREPVTPFRYEFEANGVQVVCLDSNGPAEPPRGFVSAKQIAWLGRLCVAKDDRPLVVAVHHNLLPIGSAWWDDFMRTTNGEAVHQALLAARGRLRGVFFGHVHQDADLYRDGILYSSCRSSWCQFHARPGQQATVHDTTADPGFSVVSVTRDQTFVRRHSFKIAGTW